MRVVVDVVVVDADANDGGELVAAVVVVEGVVDAAVVVDVMPVAAEAVEDGATSRWKSGRCEAICEASSVAVGPPTAAAAAEVFVEILLFLAATADAVVEDEDAVAVVVVVVVVMVQAQPVVINIRRARQWTYSLRTGTPSRR